MPFAFTYMRLEASSLYTLIANTAELQLTVGEETARITGYGFAFDIEEAFSTLVLDWEATVLLDRAKTGLPGGEYDLIYLEDRLYATRNQQKFPLPDLPVEVEVKSVPEP
jgi:hypothetical protein